MPLNAILFPPANPLAAGTATSHPQPVNSPMLNALTNVRGVADIPLNPRFEPPFCIEKVVTSIKNTGPNSTDAFLSNAPAQAAQSPKKRQSWSSAFLNMVFPGYAQPPETHNRDGFQAHQISPDTQHLQELAETYRTRSYAPQQKTVVKRSLASDIAPARLNSQTAAAQVQSATAVHPASSAHSELEHIRTRLTSTTAYVDHAGESIIVHTAMEELHALYDQYRHDLHNPAFHRTAHALLARYHLLGPALALAQQLQADTADGPLNVQPVKRSLGDNAFTRALKAIVSPQKNRRYKQSQEAYFKEWQSTLTRQESWLKDANEDVQHAVKTARDNFASADMRYKHAVARVAVHQLAPVRDFLTKHGVLTAPHSITLRATVEHSVGRHRISTAETVSLANAWFAGSITALLNAGDLRIYENGVLMQPENQQRLVEALTALPPVEAAQFFTAPDLSAAYHERLMARFDQVSLEADFKGDLLRDGHIKGLDIINAFRQGSKAIVAQHVAFSMTTLSGERLDIPLRGWLILEEKEGGIVFFNADVDEQHYFFKDKKALYEFISKRQLQHEVTVGHKDSPPPLAISAQLHGKNNVQFDIAHFFAQLKNNYAAWDTYQAKLIYTDIDDRDYYSVMRSFSNQLYDYHITGLDRSVEVKNAAQAVVYAKKHWQQVTRGKLLTLNAFTTHRIKNADMFTQFLRDKDVLRGSKKFNPDKYHVRLYGTMATFTEYAKNVRRAQGNSVNFPRDAEIIPAKLLEYRMIKNMTPAQLNEFQKKLRKAINRGILPNPLHPYFTFISSLPLTERKKLSNALALYFRLNHPDIRQGLDEALKSLYVGDEHKTYLTSLKDKNLAENNVLHDAFIAQELAELTYAVRQQQADGQLSPAEAKRLTALINRYPDTSGSEDTLSPLRINGAKISGMYLLTFANRMDSSSKTLVRKNYIFTRTYFHGRNLFDEDTFIDLLKTDPQARDTVENWALIKNKKQAHEGIGILNTDMFKLGAMPQENFNLYENMLDDRIENTSSLTLSREEVIKDLILTGVNMALLPVCIAGGPVTNAACFLGSTGLATYNLIDAANGLRQSEGEDAAVNFLFSFVDMATAGIDIMDLVKLSRQSTKAFTAMPGGMENLLRLSQQTHFSNMADVRGAKKSILRQQRFFHGNHLNRNLAVTVDLSTAKPHKIGEKHDAVIWEMGGNYYIRDREYSDEADLIYRVRFEQGGKRIRLIDPKRPLGPTEKIVWQGRWMKDHAGLLGGDHVTSLIKEAYSLRRQEIDEMIINLNNHTQFIAEGYTEVLQIFRALQDNTLPLHLKRLVDEQAAILIAKSIPGLPSSQTRKLTRLLSSRHGIDPQSEQTVQALLAYRRHTPNHEQQEIVKTLSVTLALSEYYQLSARQAHMLMQALPAAFPHTAPAQLKLQLRQLTRSSGAAPLMFKQQVDKIKNDILVKSFFNFNDANLAFFKAEVEKIPFAPRADDLVNRFLNNQLDAYQMLIFMKSKRLTVKKSLAAMTPAEIKGKLETLDYTPTAIASYNAAEINAIKRYYDYAFLPNEIKNEQRTLHEISCPLNAADVHFALYDPLTSTRVGGQKLHDIAKPAIDAQYNQLAHDYKQQLLNPHSPWYPHGNHVMNRYRNVLTGMNMETSDNAINHIFSISDGLIVGESHDKIVSKKIICNNIPAFSNNGINTLYLEGFTAEYLANDLAKFNEKNVISFRLKNAIEGIDNSNGIDEREYNLDRIFQQVRIHNINNPANKIRIIPIDAEVINFDVNSRSLTSDVNSRPVNAVDRFQVRVAMGNYIMSKAIIEDAPQRNGGKYVALVGAAHVNTHHWQGAQAIGMAPALDAVGMSCEYVHGMRKETFNVNTQNTGLGYFDVEFRSPVD